MSHVHLPLITILGPMAAVTFLSACSSSAAGPDLTPSPTVSSTTTSTAGTQPPTIARATTTSPAPTASSAPRLDACAESQLRASASIESVLGVDRHVARLVFTNTSASTCTLTGYPGAAIVDTSGKQVQQAERVVGGPVAGTVERVGTVPVPPGNSVFAYLEGQSTREKGAAQGGCDAPKYPKIVITPPNTRTAVPFTIGWPQCYSFNVHPVRQQ